MSQNEIEMSAQLQADKKMKIFRWVDGKDDGPIVDVAPEDKPTADVAPEDKPTADVAYDDRNFFFKAAVLAVATTTIITTVAVLARRN